MQDTQPEEKLAGSNEISLIDILAVLLRSRRLIVGTTALALVLAILAVVLIPSIVLAKTSIDKIYEAVVSTRISSSVLVFVSQELVDDFLQQSLSEPTIILAALREAGIEKIDTINLAEQNEDQLLFSIRRRLVENRAISGAALPEEQRLYTTQTAKGGFQVSINYPDPLLAKNFLLALIQHTNIRMTALVYPMAEAETYSFEKIAELEYPRDVIEQNLFETFYRYTAASRFIEGNEPALVVTQDPYVLIQSINIAMIRDGIIKKCIIGVVVVFFLSIFMAFLLQWISSVKTDTAAMAKIRQAMAGSRK
ncbi:MAG: hypothetical protein A2087_06645 [Spirochaetes bacterium GWD1_61_31]|nr:MAG: hypothetical protein A2Y37_08825 [Spirochaetes bacterium GWB1_60_80]OHD31875.1 MAG: hypothetical protein A2004_10210 [Spirochaetes bacterium GWC1_61_12]OHD40028.1 MAG: hypothetical protein A2087_06645 [Spirochaetes bacterium GWD1_61_31]OHD42318.1 MAG: hypothetical protein A2Y35_11355 [Spirochaetes bacterium GWE1_60_18]OHD58468.1 MAG: hypothetical protein A2Y32_06860 [Spirochaetes bacterium GWF1_60_12]HAW85459.1 hypothetical protein [Spirochaetaceae bacterium]